MEAPVSAECLGSLGLLRPERASGTRGGQAPPESESQRLAELSSQGPAALLPWVGCREPSGQPSGQIPGQVSGRVPGWVPGQMSGQVSGQVSGQGPGQVSGWVPGQVPGRVPGQRLPRSPPLSLGLVWSRRSVLSGSRGPGSPGGPRSSLNPAPWSWPVEVSGSGAEGAQHPAHIHRIVGRGRKRAPSGVWAPAQLQAPP